MIHKSFICAMFCPLLWLGVSGPSLAQEEGEERPIRIIEPDRPNDSDTIAAIDSERFEFGLYSGTLSVEDFGTELLTGIELSYHLKDKWLLQVNYGRAQIDEAAFENSRRPFLSGSERDFEYLSFTGAYRLVEGRSFFGAQSKFNSSLYALAGPERVRFADNKEWGLGFGLSYRMVITDRLTANVDFREHMFERTFIGDSKTTFNTELRIGVNALF